MHRWSNTVVDAFVILLIVIAAKTAEPHPKLPGTVFTAAEEIEKAGGKAVVLGGAPAAV